MLKFFLSLILSVNAMAHDVVYVGLYNFPPYAEVSGVKAQGAVVDLINLLNDKLEKSNIELRPYLTSPKRRYQDYEENKYDYIFFESPIWGWRKYKLNSSETLATDGEKYLSLKSNYQVISKEDLYNKKIAAILGYHYGFAAFNSDEDILKKKYNIILTNDHEKNIDLILKGRADLAIITESYFKMKANANRDLTKKLQLSQDYDQIYNHKILGRPTSKLTMDKLLSAIAELKKENKLKEIGKRYHINFP